ncbi:MAG: folylpolyglutamate synthase/dihydrofolate synthase family protein [Candidatus Diapherotrites archaeon]
MDSKAEELLASFDLHRVDLGLERIKAFLKEQGNPEKDLNYVHVTGTNGKGSTSAFIASALKEEGFKTGLYLSPHLKSFGERIQINGEQINEKELEKLVLEAGELKKKTGIDLSYFEFITAIAFKHFSEKKCDFVVLEVGMGGRLDATNVVVPKASVITPISIEHSRHLGDTIGKIAVEKAGIIKEGVPVVSAFQEKEALEVIEKKCKELNAWLSLASRDFSHIRRSSSLELQEFDYISQENEFKGLKIRLAGRHQFVNAAVATRVMEILKLSEKAIRKGLEKAFIPGRLQVIKTKPLVLIDVAHNPGAAKILKEALRELFPEQKALFVLGVSEDKDINGIVSELAFVAESFVCTQAKFRGMNAEKIRLSILENGFTGEIKVEPEVKNAVLFALSKKKPLTVFTGSFFSVSEALQAME